MPETWKIVVAIVLVAVFFLFIYYRHVSDLRRQDRISRARRDAGDVEPRHSDRA